MRRAYISITASRVTGWMSPLRQPLPLTRAHGASPNDDRMVVVMAAVPVGVPAAARWIRLGLPPVGAALSAVHPAAPGQARRGPRRCVLRPPRVGMGRRSRVDGALHLDLLGPRGFVVALRQRRASACRLIHRQRTAQRR